MPIPELLINQQTAFQDVMLMECQYLKLGEAIAVYNEECKDNCLNLQCVMHFTFGEQEWHKN